MKMLYSFIKSQLFQQVKSKPSLVLFVSLIITVLTLGIVPLNWQERGAFAIFSILINTAVYFFSKESLILAFGSASMFLVLLVNKSQVSTLVCLVAILLLSSFIFKLALDIHKDLHSEFDSESLRLLKENELWKERFDTLHNKLQIAKQDMEILEEKLSTMKARAEKEKSHFITSLQQVVGKNK